jgi:hypothetical protein
MRISRFEIFAVERAALYGQVDGGIYLEITDPEESDLFATTGGGVAERLSEKLREEPTFANDEVNLGRYKSALLIDSAERRQLGLVDLAERVASSGDSIAPRSLTG